MPQSGWLPSELDNQTFSQRTSYPAGVAQASKMGEAATDFMPIPSLYVGDMINVEAQSPSINGNSRALPRPTTTADKRQGRSGGRNGD
jgi:uncharacterized protein YfaP (DUF2135 family)